MNSGKGRSVSGSGRPLAIYLAGVWCWDNPDAVGPRGEWQQQVAVGLVAQVDPRVLIPGDIGVAFQFGGQRIVH